MSDVEICGICGEEYDDDPDQIENREESHLPVQSSQCQHIQCYSCVIKYRLSKAERVSDKQFPRTKWVQCPFCKKKTCFNAEKPIVSHVVCELLRDRREKTTPALTSEDSSDREENAEEANQKRKQAEASGVSKNEASSASAKGGKKKQVQQVPGQKSLTSFFGASATSKSPSTPSSQDDDDDDDAMDVDKKEKEAVYGEMDFHFNKGGNDDADKGTDGTGGKKKKRTRRKLVEKTSVDARGFLVTEKVWEEEEIPTDEEDNGEDGGGGGTSPSKKLKSSSAPAVAAEAPSPVPASASGSASVSASVQSSTRVSAPSPGVGDVGYEFIKDFPGYGRYRGKVVEIYSDGYRRCYYEEDGDEEDMTLDQLRTHEPFLRPPQAAAATTSASSSGSGSGRVEGGSKADRKSSTADQVDSPMDLDEEEMALQAPTAAVAPAAAVNGETTRAGINNEPVVLELFLQNPADVLRHPVSGQSPSLPTAANSVPSRQPGTAVPDPKQGQKPKNAKVWNRSLAMMIRERKIKKEEGGGVTQCFTRSDDAVWKKARKAIKAEDADEIFVSADGSIIGLPNNLDKKVTRFCEQVINGDPAVYLRNDQCRYLMGAGQQRSITIGGEVSERDESGNIVKTQQLSGPFALLMAFHESGDDHGIYTTSELQKMQEAICGREVAQKVEGLRGYLSGIWTRSIKTLERRGLVERTERGEKKKLNRKGCQDTFELTKDGEFFTKALIRFRGEEVRTYYRRDIQEEYFGGAGKMKHRDLKSMARKRRRLN